MKCRIGVFPAFVLLCCLASSAQAPPLSGSKSDQATADAKKASPNPSTQAPCRLTPASAPQGTPHLSATELDFGDHDIGTTTDPCAVTFTSGDDPIVGLHVEPDSGYSAPRDCPERLGRGESCAVRVSFSPNAVGDLHGTLRASFTTLTGSAGSAELKLSGKGFLFRLAASPNFLDFGSQLVNSTSAVQTVTLKAGTANVKIPAITASGDFTVTPAKCNDLAPGASCALAVTFSPKHVGTTTGAITVTSDASPVTVSLVGTGSSTCDSQSCTSGNSWLKSAWPVLLIVFVYLVALIAVRWNMIAVPTRRLLIAQIDSVRARVAGLDQKKHPAIIQQITALLDKAFWPVRLESDVADATGQWRESRAYRLADRLLWTRGQESASWNRVHEAEEELVSIQGAETVHAGLVTAVADLRALNKPAASALADRIDEAWKGSAPDSSLTLLRDVLDLLSQGGALTAEIDQALSALTADQAKQLAGKIVALLSPAATSLAAKIQSALSVTPSTASAAITQLLQQAASTLNPGAATLVAALQPNIAAATPLTVDQWKPLLQTARDYLSQQSALLAKVREALAHDPLPRLRALLSDALGIIYDSRDNHFASLASSQNKTVWMVGCGLLLIVVLTAVFQDGVLFLVGATGGLLSRLSRTLYRQDVPTDYGASWTTLFLSPVVGALTGWSGILLVVLGVELNVVGSALKVDWCNPYSPIALALAFVLGFSERAFDNILNQVQGKMPGGTPSTTSTASTNPVTPTTSTVQPTPTLITPAQPMPAQPLPVAQTSPPAPADLQITTRPMLAAAKQNQPYPPQTLAASGGTSLKWTLTTGTLPDGLSLDPSGIIAGTPTSLATTSKFTLQVTDASGKTKSQEFTIAVGL